LNLKMTGNPFSFLTAGMGAVGRAAMCAAALATAVAPVQAQIVSDEEAAPTTSLNIPEGLTLYGNTDPNVRTATAVVNGEVITGTDVDQRLALVMSANQNANMTEEDIARLRLQVLRNLIDETLQIQAAEADELTVTPDEVRQNFARVAQQNNQTPEQLDEYLASIGSSGASLRRQIWGEIAWSRVISRNVGPFVNVSEEEVNDMLDEMKKAQGTEEYRLGEIYLSASSENAQQVEATARQILDQVRGGGSFVAYARQFSEASTAAVGGDLGWVRLAQLPPQLALVARELQVGQVVGPVEIPGGFSILYLIDKRQVAMADPRDAMLSLKQVSISFPPGATEATARAAAEQFATQTQAIRGCGDVQSVADKLGASVVTNDQVRIRDLPRPLQQPLLQMNVGQSTPPFGSVEDGIRVLVLCGRDDPQQIALPSFEVMRDNLEQERIGRRAQIYLRDLRRDAIIDYN
jgi:peptidyl-prolyl cis-trans isomerase SurA